MYLLCTRVLFFGRAFTKDIFIQLSLVGGEERVFCIQMVAVLVCFNWSMANRIVLFTPNEVIPSSCKGRTKEEELGKKRRSKDTLAGGVLQLCFSFLCYPKVVFGEAEQHPACYVVVSEAGRMLMALIVCIYIL